MPPTNYAFGGGRVQTRPSSGVQTPRLSAATTDTVTGISRAPIATRQQQLSVNPEDNISQDVALKNQEVNNFGSQITAMKQAAQRRKEQEEAQRNQGVALRPQQESADFTSYNGPATGARAQLVNSALSLQGERYAWGGGGPGVRQSHGVPGGPGSNVIGVDCSGLTSYAYSQIGIRIPHLARAQGAIGYRTSINNLQPGDLVVWNNGSHTSMYMGNGRIVESVPSTGPRVRYLRPGEAVTGVHIRLPGE